jgi:group II intron reverse transcriptase/maturase
MENKILRKLDILRKNNTETTWINKDSELYSFLVKKEMYIIAYENLKSNKGALTPGTDNKTLDGFSEKTIERICNQMKNESFKFDRARRIYIPKISGKLRPLGIPSAKDKIVQEVVRILLEAIWDSPKNPTFYDVSHGFRPGRGTHSALQYIDFKFKNMKWCIEGDIKGAYENINHDILIKLLEQRIQPGKFLRLVRKTLNAGYLEINTPVNNYLGTPQGSVLSPILANIYFHELDVYVNQLIKKIKDDNSSKTLAKARNPEYTMKRNILTRSERVHKKFPNNETSTLVKMAKKELLNVNVSIDHSLPVRIQYVRYADDWIIGVDGSLKVAKQIKDEIQEFLKNTLKLQLNLEKTKITHLKSNKAFFLGHTIETQAGVKISSVNKGIPGKKTFQRRTTGYHLKIKAPIAKLIKKLSADGFCKANGFPQSKKAWTVLEDHVIVSNYNKLLLGLTGYYSGADNQKSLRNIQYILQYSCAMTLGHKHRKGIPEIFKKFGTSLKVRVPYVNSEKKSEVSLKLKDFSKNKKLWRTRSNLGNPYIVMGTKMTRSSLGLPCCICESIENIEMHHVKHVRKSSYKYQGFHRIMHLLNRKQIPVCKVCHKKIHDGKYHGLKLGDLRGLRDLRRGT